MSDQPTPWDVLRQYGPAGAFHHRNPAADTGPEVWVRTIPRPALVLGSTQPDGLVRAVRAEADGIEVCRRRSGGGLVWVDPATDCWIDVIVPKDSPLWEPDIGRAFHWLGDLWGRVLTDTPSSGGSASSREPAGPDAGSQRVVVHRKSGPRSDGSTAGRVWCFADLGHGEVSIDGSKVVGLSQRRTKTWARLQGLVLGAWPGERLAEYVDLEVAATLAPDATEAELQPGAIAAGFPAELTPPSPRQLAERFLTSLPES